MNTPVIQAEFPQSMKDAARELFEMAHAWVIETYPGGAATERQLAISTVSVAVGALIDEAQADRQVAVGDRVAGNDALQGTATALADKTRGLDWPERRMVAHAVTQTMNEAWKVMDRSGL